MPFSQGHSIKERGRESAIRSMGCPSREEVMREVRAHSQRLESMQNGYEGLSVLGHALHASGIQACGVHGASRGDRGEVHAGGKRAIGDDDYEGMAAAVATAIAKAQLRMATAIRQQKTNSYHKPKHPTGVKHKDYFPRPGIR